MASFSVEKLPEQENVILVTVEGKLNIDVVKSIYSQIATITANMEGPIYRITDVRKEQSEFGDMLKVIKEAGSGSAGTTTDPRIQNIFLGRGKMARLAKDVLENTMRGMKMPVVDTLEEALEFIEKDRAKRSGRS